MKKTLLVFSVHALACTFTPLVADPPTGYDPVPLPSGPILAKAPDFSMWRIDYSYASQRGGSNGSAAPNAGTSPAPTNPHLPKTLTMSHAKAIWHAVMVDLSGEKHETWYDGTRRYEQGADSSKFIPITNGASDSNALKSYLGNGQEFPNVEWVSPNTYLGTEKGSGLWVFQQADDGAKLWVNPATRFPVRWTKGGETRSFESLPASADSLTLPSSIARTSEALKHLDAISRAAPAGL